ncbi:Pentatricopeptide repeat [Dillenia turbinata]|uniref:Pentatricopeptide repeat n=1 Tax=Dillenia turbinata TaxID=194707 RepID=A0AAN8YXG9_9MAGN
MSVRDIAMLNALIIGLAQGDNHHGAVSLFKKMREENLMPNEITVLGALSACLQLGVRESENTLREISSTALVAAFCRSDKTENAENPQPPPHPPPPLPASLTVSAAVVCCEAGGCSLVSISVGESAI